ncbi:MAG: hypothetical protein KDD89_13810, partial [Anaerolineales bacterium]|nr:hypothetical protein [Anaerolineales bacterium]
MATLSGQRPDCYNERVTSHRPLLQTKLHQPPPRPDIVPRPRLLDQLNDGLRGKLTLVTAPAGFGKTTLVINWLNQRPPSEHTAVAWLSLDERDDDPHRFYTYLLAAYQQANPALGHKATPLLAHDALEPEYILTHLLNDLQSQPALLVLDDFHLVTAVEIRHGIQFLLDNLPPKSHLVLTSRHTPQLQLARWRARRQLTEIAVQDLRFLPEEAGTLLHQELGRALDSPALETLLRRTEGWAAGLQLAALSLKREPHPDQFIAQFAGTDRYVLDYLLDEVFAGQSAEMRHFLLTTAVLDRFCAPLCDALTNGQPPAQAALAHLEQSNLFIIPLDHKRRWFRYHHLFRDLLRHRLQAHHSAQQRQDLLLAASHWCERETLFEEAVQYALAAQAYDRAAQLLEKTALFTLWGVGDAQTIAQQIQRLPSATLAAFPRLYIGLYWAMLY